MDSSVDLLASGASLSAPSRQEEEDKETALDMTATSIGAPPSAAAHSETYGYDDEDFEDEVRVSVHG